MSFLVVVTIDLGVVVVFHGAQVFLQDELLPDVDDFLVEVLGFLDLTLLFEDFTHVVITAAQVDTLRTPEGTLQVYGMGEFVQSLLGGTRFILT